MNIKLLLTAGCIASAFAAGAQNANRGYAITGDGNKDYMWMNIREVDLSTGQVTKTLFQHGKTNYTVTDALTKITTDGKAINPENFYSPSQFPTATMVAAAAYDRRTNKLFFTPMRMGELRWMDMSLSLIHI